MIDAGRAVIADTGRLAADISVMQQRLQKILAAAGIASRRKAEALISQGLVTVNGCVARLGEKADPQVDAIQVAGKRIRAEAKTYLAVYKPKNCLTTVSDQRGRSTVVELIDVAERVVPAGRLDYQSEGLIILSNDGDLIRRITRAGSCSKVYLVKIRGRLTEEDRDRLQKGVRLEGKKLAPCRVKMHKPGDNCWYEVTLFQGVNRQIRRMFAARGHLVSKIRRIAIGPVRLGKLMPGQWRPLTGPELAALRALDKN